MTTTLGIIYVSIFFQQRHNFEGLLHKWKSADHYLQYRESHLLWLTNCKAQAESDTVLTTHFSY